MLAVTQKKCMGNLDMHTSRTALAVRQTTTNKVLRQMDTKQSTAIWHKLAKQKQIMSGRRVEKETYENGIRKSRCKSIDRML